MSFRRIVNGQDVFNNINANSVDANAVSANIINATDIYADVGFDTFVAVAQSSNNAAYSTNGITWTTTSLPSTGYQRKVIYGDTKFISPGDDTVAYSTDGAFWQDVAISQPPGIGSTTWGAPAYGNEKFVSLAVDSINDSLPAYAAYSTDALSWTISTTPGYATSLAYGNGVFVAVNGELFEQSTFTAYSTDAITWTANTMPQNAEWAAITHNGNIFVAVGGGLYSDGYAAQSTDGITWTSSSLPVPGSGYASWVSVAHGGDAWVAMAGGYDSLTLAAYSTDGITWTQTTMPASALWQSVTYGDGTFAAVAYNSTTAAYSTNGITWTQTTLSASSGWTSVTYAKRILSTKINDLL